MKSIEQPAVHRLDIPCELDPKKVASRIHIPARIERLKDAALELTRSAIAMARPVGLYMEAPCTVLDRDSVEIGGTVFKSRALSKNLEKLDRVYPFIVSIGKELDEYPLEKGDMMLRFFLDGIKTTVLVTAVGYLASQVQQKYELAGNAHMNPGEIPDWPITEQQALFSLFRGAEKEIGVEVRPSGIMKPIKSRSGVIFQNDCGFATCWLCTQHTCAGRRYKYDPEKVKEYLGEPA